MAKPSPKKLAPTRRRTSIRRSRGRRRVDAAPVPALHNDEIDAVQHEKHGLIEEAIEPPPARDGDDIERQ